MLEPYDGKLSRTVLRRESGGNTADLLDRCLLKANIPLAELVLRIITDKKDLIITGCETQRDMKRLAGARSICLDAYGTDADGKKDLEVQKANDGADPHRARYHSSVMDVENLHSGQDFKELPETYTIFITELFKFSNNSVYPKKMIIRAGKPETAQVKGSCSFLLNNKSDPCLNRYTPIQYNSHSTNKNIKGLITYE